MERVAEIQVSWLGWVVLHVQCRPGQPIPAPPWWPAGCLSLPSRMRWQPDGRLRVDDDVLRDEVSFKEESVDVRVRWTAARRAAPGEPASPELVWWGSFSTMGAVMAALSMMVLQAPRTFETVLYERPESFGRYFDHSQRPIRYDLRASQGRNGGEGTAASGEAGLSGEDERSDVPGIGTPMRDASSWTSTDGAAYTIALGVQKDTGGSGLGNAVTPERGVPDAEQAEAGGAGIAQDGNGLGAGAETDGASMAGQDGVYFGVSGSGFSIEEQGSPWGEHERRDGYIAFQEFDAARDPVSSFALVANPGSYGDVRAALRRGKLPQAAWPEDLVNARRYPLRNPGPDELLSVEMESVASPWRDGARLLRISLQAHLAPEAPRDVVVSVDEALVRWSASSLKEGLHELIDALPDGSRLAVVTDDTVLTPRATVTDRAALHRVVDRFDWVPGETAAPTSASVVHLIDARSRLEDLGEGTVLCVEKRDARDCRDDARRSSVGEALRRVTVGERPVAVESASVSVRFDPAVVSSYRFLGDDLHVMEDPEARQYPRAAGVDAGHQITGLYEYVPTGADGTIAAVTISGDEGREWERSLRTHQHRDTASPCMRVAVGAAGLAGMLRGDAWAEGADAAELAALAASDDELVELIWRADALLQAR